jgi:aspartyl-tRNA(Asn)/glutamyl-tRNA(Gln) amidotransferase subunit A
MPSAERAGVDAEVLAAYDRSIEQLADMGADIVDLSLPRGFRDYGMSSGRLMSAEAYALLSDIVDNNALSLDEAVRPRIRAGATISAREYLSTLAEREELKAVDQSTTPALFTRWGNFLDLCALAVPNGFTRTGLPLSLQIVCRGGDEALALRIGWAWQNATDWHERSPQLP